MTLRPLPWHVGSHDTPMYPAGIASSHIAPVNVVEYHGPLCWNTAPRARRASTSGSTGHAAALKPCDVVAVVTNVELFVLEV